MNFTEILLRAKAKDSSAIEAIFKIYRPLLISQSTLSQKIDDDLFQENCSILLRCINSFSVSEKQKNEK